MKVRGSVAFVTGANRGLGLSFTEELVARGADRVYAGMRRIEDANAFPPGVIPVVFDVNDLGSVRAAAAQCTDVNLLINNAGIPRVNENTLDPDWIESSRDLLDTNFYGVVRATQAFAPVLRGNGGGAVVNVLSDAAWFSRPVLSGYSASKSAAWSYTNASRIDLQAQGTRVVAMHVGFLDTDMTRGLELRKTAPRFAAAAVLAALEAGEEEALVDAGTQDIKRSLSGPQPYYLAVQDLA